MESSRGCRRTGVLPGGSPESLHREEQTHEEEERREQRGGSEEWERKRAGIEGFKTTRQKGM